MKLQVRYLSKQLGAMSGENQLAGFWEWVTLERRACGPLVVARPSQSEHHRIVAPSSSVHHPLPSHRRCCRRCRIVGDGNLEAKGERNGRWTPPLACPCSANCFSHCWRPLQIIIRFYCFCRVLYDGNPSGAVKWWPPYRIFATEYFAKWSFVEGVGVSSVGLAFLVCFTDWSELLSRWCAFQCAVQVVSGDSRWFLHGCSRFVCHFNAGMNRGIVAIICHLNGRCGNRSEATHAWCSCEMALIKL